MDVCRRSKKFGIAWAQRLRVWLILETGPPHMGYCAKFGRRWANNTIILNADPSPKIGPPGSQLSSLLKISESDMVLSDIYIFLIVVHSNCEPIKYYF